MNPKSKNKVKLARRKSKHEENESWKQKREENRYDIHALCLFPAMARQEVGHDL